MPLPSVKIVKQTTSLGGIPATEDGVSLLVVNAPTAYVTTGNLVFNSLKQAEDAGITEAIDLSNDYLFWEHVKDFFSQADGTELHVLRVPEATTITNLFTVANANYVLLQNKLASNGGKIKLLGVAIKPTSTETNTGLSSDIITAIPLAQAFADLEYTKLRPLDIFLEGRKLTGTSANAQNLRGLSSGNVSVMVARDGDRKAALTTAGNSGADNYAAVGYLLGTVANIHVGRDIGRVKSGALVGITNPEFSGGQKIFTDYTESDMNILNDKGYIFFTKFPNKNGFFFTPGHTCAAENLSNAYVNLNRSLNKASRIALSTYVEELNDEIEVDVETGQLTTLTVQSLQNNLEIAIRQEMISNPDPTRPQELSGVKVTIDPAQNVLATGKIVVLLQITPLANVRTIETKVELINPAN